MTLWLFSQVIHHKEVIIVRSVTGKELLKMRLIDAERLRSAMWYTFGEQDDYMERGMAKWESGLWLRYKAVEEVLDSQPTIEAEPVRHSEAVVSKNGGTTFWYECGLCGGAIDIHDAYCKHCGAKMDGGENEL